MEDMNNNNNKEEDEIEFEENEVIFLNPADAIEVEVDDDIPMEDDEEETTQQQQQQEQQQQSIPSKSLEIVDMSLESISCHKGSSVYTIAAHLDQQSSSLSFVSGGGDDKAFLHILNTTTATTNQQQQQQSSHTIPLEHPHTDSVSCVAMNTKYVSKDLKKTPNYLAVGSYDGTIALYDPISGTKIQILDGPTDVEFLSFHPKGGSVLLAGSIADATVWMYHLPTSKCLQVFVGHECNSEGGGVTTGSFTPDGKFAVTAGMDGTLRLWAPRTGLCKHVFKLAVTNDDGGAGNSNGGGLTCLSMNGGQDGQLAICGGEDGNAYVVHLQGKKLVATLNHFDVSQTATNNNNHTNSTFTDDGMDVDNDEIIITSVEALGFATKEVNANWVASGGSDGILKVWDLTNGVGQCRQTCTVPSAHTDSSGGITHLTWHPTMPIIFVSYADGIVRLWDARDGTIVHSLSGGTPSADNQINDFATEFRGLENGSAGVADVVTANDDGMVKVYSVDVQAVLLEAAAKVNTTTLVS
eukprot:CAMPEP_0198255222 /NCGR_PEP_ID=MMETSP1447-20131203/5386_1 /TAXON_ID=420782 /ORGANISM="Chaetoceros dichaeta, Strain CCMP1751" /LENGTH=524 /DNA_ID=CAMNT_0043941541 /DNA_START=58 /DNA_END=1632 /DNA_ORIENTATION=+